MSSSPFIHLHVHSEYSLLDGLCRLKDLAKAAKKMSMPALALTDHGNLFGAIEFYKTCKDIGVKPIIGCETYLAPGPMTEKKGGPRESSTHFLLLAKDETGYANLIKLISAAHISGHHYKPRIDKEILAKHAKGLIGTSACLKSEISQYILKGQIAQAEKSVDDFRQIFDPGDFYLEMHNHGLPDQVTVNRELIRMSKMFGLKLVAANDVHYVQKEHSAAHDILLCIGTGSQLNDEKRLRYGVDEFYFKSPEEMAALFPETPEALATTLEIAEKCNLKLELGVNKFPQYTVPEGVTREGYLRQLCQEGMITRFGSRATDPELVKRLDYELSVLEKTGFTSYFLIVWDFIHYAKTTGIPVGPGRGSAAGSLIAYVLGITDLDPLRYGLFFERFLNPERISPPDIDVDFCYNRRPEVIEYVRRKYGNTSVSMIITYGTLGAKMVVRDVSRVLGLSYGDADRIAKMIPNDLKFELNEKKNKEGKVESNGFRDVPELLKAYESDDNVKQVLDAALTLEGVTRQTGVHAAGVVIADRELTDYIPLTTDDQGNIVTQYSMEWLGEVGMLKMDFLGLKTLTVIDDALKLIKDTTGKSFQCHEIPLEDLKTYEMLQAGKTVGVFQLESGGMIGACRQIKPERIEDLIALVALYRPGPMEFIPLYAERKHGTAKVEYPHELLEPILKETYGVIIYQEQVMQSAQILAGYTLGGADLLRRAMGKKKQEEMDKQRAMFIKGAGEINGIPPDRASEVFDILDKFAGYGFNKAHAACYGYLAYLTAWLKANYPVQFLAALMSNDLNNTDKIAQYIEESRVMGIPVLGPCVNHSEVKFSVPNQSIRFGMAAIKNAGEAAVEAIVVARKNGGHFTSIRDLCSRVAARTINKKTLESLIKTGACDVFGSTRSQLMTEIDMSLAQATRDAKDREIGQGSLLDMLDEAPASVVTKTVGKAPLPEWPSREKLAFEKELMGFYLSGHPLQDCLEELKSLQVHTVSNVVEDGEIRATRLAGLITRVEVKMSKDNRPWAIFGFEDQTGAIEGLAFSDTYAGFEKDFKSGDIVVISGTLDRRDEGARLRVNELLSLESARTKYYKAVRISVPLADWSSTKWHELMDVLMQHTGPVRLQFRCVRSDRCFADIEAKDIFGVAVTSELFNAVTQLPYGIKIEVVASQEINRPKSNWGPRRAKTT